MCYICEYKQHVREYGLIAHCLVMKHENCFACWLYPESFDSQPRMSSCFLSQPLIQKSDLFLRGSHPNSSPFGCAEGEYSHYYELDPEPQALVKNCKIMPRLSLHVFAISDFFPSENGLFHDIGHAHRRPEEICAMSHDKFQSSEIATKHFKL